VDAAPAGTLIVMVGLPASGKTTFARRLQIERRAVRFTPDEWMIPLFDAPEADGKRDVLEGRFIWLALEVLTAGVDVILDFGVWSRDERWALRSLALDVGARCELIYLAVAPEEQLARIAHRREIESSTTFDIGAADLLRFAGLFEEPTPDELSGTTIPAAPQGSRSWREWAAHRWPTSTG
jgi:predicted kinase